MSLPAISPDVAAVDAAPAEYAQVHLDQCFRWGRAGREAGALEADAVT
jgi:hypothetical protein